MTQELNKAPSEEIPLNAAETPANGAGNGLETASKGAQTAQESAPQDVPPKCPVGAPRRNQNARVHGMSVVEEAWQQHKPVDRRTRSGRIERQVIAAFSKAYARQLEGNPRLQVLIGLVGYDASRQDEHKRCRRARIKEVPKILENPKALSLLDNYEQPCINSLREDLKALPEPDEVGGESLEDVVGEIIREREQQQDSEGGESV